jgi:hypothetical protein
VYSKVSGLSHNEIYTYLWHYSLRSNKKGYGDKTHYTDSENSDTTAPNGREMYLCSSRSRRPVRELLDTHSYTHTHTHTHAYIYTHIGLQTGNGVQWNLKKMVQSKASGTKSRLLIKQCSFSHRHTMLARVLHLAAHPPLFPPQTSGAALRVKVSEEKRYVRISWRTVRSAILLNTY